MLGEGLVAADDLGGIVKAELGGPVGEPALDAAAHHLLVHREHDNLVVGQELVLDRPAETAREQHLPVQRLVVHRAEDGGLLAGAGLDRLAEHARCGRHIEALAAGDERLVVDTHEVALVPARERSAGGAVGLVADDEVELGEIVPVLRGGDDLDRLVGREHDRHPVRCRLRDLRSQLRRVGGGGVIEVVRLDLGEVARRPAALADLGVGADGERTDGDGRVDRPLADALAHQG